MLKDIKEVYKYRNTLVTLTRESIKTRYKNAVLGYVWTVLNPVALSLVLGFIFSSIIRVEIKDFPLFVLSGLFAWNFFANSTLESSLSILNNSNMAQKFPFPLEIIPFSTVLINLFIFLISILAILPFFLIRDFRIFLTLAFFPVVTLSLVLFTFGISLLLSCINVYFKDTHHLFQTLIILWFWMTPVFYTLEMVPENFRWLCLVNPMTLYIATYRDIFWEVRLPNLSIFFLAFFISAVVFYICYVIFIKLKPNLIKHL